MNGIKKALRTIESHQSAADYEQALNLIDEALRKWPDHPRLLTQRGMLIQLMEGAGPDLEEATHALSAAIDSDPKAMDSMVELGQYLYAIEDDAKAAMKQFEAAENLAEQTLVVDRGTDRTLEMLEGTQSRT